MRTEFTWKTFEEERCSLIRKRTESRTLCVNGLCFRLSEIQRHRLDTHHFQWSDTHTHTLLYPKWWYNFTFQKLWTSYPSLCTDNLMWSSKKKICLKENYLLSLFGRFVFTCNIHYSTREIIICLLRSLCILMMILTIINNIRLIIRY